MVIDVKNDEGRVVYDMDSAFVREIGAVKEYVSDMPGLIRKCKEHGIYLIARIVAFKDPFLAENRQDLALTDKNGSIFRDKSGLAWVNPYKGRYGIIFWRLPGRRLLSALMRSSLIISGFRQMPECQRWISERRPWSRTRRMS